MVGSIKEFRYSCLAFIIFWFKLKEIILLLYGLKLKILTFRHMGMNWQLIKRQGYEMATDRYEMATHRV